MAVQEKVDRCLALEEFEFGKGHKWLIDVSINFFSYMQKG
jgi:hypothetical protein